MKTFWIQTLGCKVNQYESEQIATLLRSRGLMQVDNPQAADLRVINTCSVTSEAAAKSRQAARRAVQLPVLRSGDADAAQENRHGRTIVTGCWATSNKDEARQLLPRIDADAVLTHTDDVAGQIHRLLRLWQPGGTPSCRPPAAGQASDSAYFQGPDRDEGSIKLRAGAPGIESPSDSKPQDRRFVKHNLGATSLPLLDQRHSGHQRAFLKIQDGCDAHCTYCIIPHLRPMLWSKPVDDAVEEARRLVAAGHREIVLSGIFLGAFGQPTALRRRQSRRGALGEMVQALCTRVPGLCRLRLSSLEPLDLTDDLLATLKSHAQVVPHFHLPLQSGSDPILRRMNRQYTRDDYLRMVERVEESFDRPALTTDIIVGFPGESDDHFVRTLEVVDRAQFIHIHAFSFSPRPGTAAARWRRDFVDAGVARDRIATLNARAAACGFAYRSSFLGETAQVMVEQSRDAQFQHGRCERYFDIYFKHDADLTSRAVTVRIERVSPNRTFGSVVSIEDAP